MISVVPSRRWLIARDLIMSSVTAPPALRMTCASPLPRPSSAVTSSRASMQATIATCLDGRPEGGQAMRMAAAERLAFLARTFRRRDSGRQRMAGGFTDEGLAALDAELARH